MDPPDADIGSPPTGSAPRPPSPALSALLSPPHAPKHPAADSGNNPAATGLELDMSINAAVSALVHHLVQPLAAHYPHADVMALRSDLTLSFTTIFTPTWKECTPHSGSGSRSLIADSVSGLPAVLKAAAAKHGVDPAKWNSAIAASRRKKVPGPEAAEWEVWCDPGMVVWRWGGWGWDEPEFDPIKRPRESFQVVWQAAPAPRQVTSPLASTTPGMRSRAIPIRAPALLRIPASPSPASSVASDLPGLLPAADIVDSVPSHGRSSSGDFIRRDQTSPTHTGFARAHKGKQSSTSSNSSDSSDTNSHTQLLTPGSRPGSADLFPEPKVKPSVEDTPRGRDRSPAAEPTVTPYDGGNVTVLGGGTKLGGSRPPSVMSSRGDRTRSPSVSIASRALLTAVGPNSNGAPGSPRKPRTRRRIIPTHIGYFGQPGIGAPMLASFGSHKHQPGQPYWPQGQPGAGVGVGVGVGVAPPPVGMPMPSMPMKRVV